MRRATTLLLSALLLACGPDTGGGDSDAPAQTCEELTQTASQFLLDNSACESAADCVYADKGCYAGPEVSCVAVSHVADDAVAAEWSQLLDELSGVCTSQCGGSECGASVDCIDNRCTAVFP